MNQFTVWYNEYSYILVIALSLAFLALSIEIARQSFRLKKFVRSYDKLFGDASGQALEKLLEIHMERVQTNGRQIEELYKEFRRLNESHKGAVQHVGLIRFNPFDDTGSDQSFSVAFLDDLDNGVVLTSLHNRAATRVYAKPIQKGQPVYPLSTEEKEAIESARKGVGG